MKRISLAIIDHDDGYANALSKAITLKSEQFDVHTAPSSQWEKFDLVLMNEAETDSVQNEIRDKLILLTEKKCRMPWRETKSRPFFLYKYENLSLLIAALQYYYSKIYGCSSPFSVFEKEPFVVGVCSGSGGIGCTSVSILLARELTEKKKKKVLFLSLEEVESASLYFSFPEGHPFMGDYLYYLFSNDEKRKTSTFYSAFQYQDSYGVDLFYPSCGCNELCKLSVEEVHLFIESISTIGNYDYIILDCGSHFSKEILYWMRQCNQCILLKNGTAVSAEKNKKRLEVFQKQQHFDCSRFLEYCISKDEESFIERDHKVDIYVNYTLGSEVKRIADRVRCTREQENSSKSNYRHRSLSNQREDGRSYG